jgi:hypothetical protein
MEQQINIKLLVKWNNKETTTIEQTEVDLYNKSASSTYNDHSPISILIEWILYWCDKTKRSNIVQFDEPIELGDLFYQTIERPTYNDFNSNYQLKILHECIHIPNSYEQLLTVSVCRDTHKHTSECEGVISYLKRVNEYNTWVKKIIRLDCMIVEAKKDFDLRKTEVYRCESHNGVYHSFTFATFDIDEGNKTTFTELLERINDMIVDIERSYGHQSNIRMYVTDKQKRSALTRAETGIRTLQNLYDRYHRYIRDKQELLVLTQ